MATEISKLAVVLTGSSAGFTTTMQQSGREVVTLQQRVAGARSGLEGFGASAARVGGIFSGWKSLLGGIGLGFSVWSGFEKWKESEQTAAKLDAVIRSTGMA